MNKSQLVNLPKIRVVLYKGQYYSLDNRRLYVMKEVSKGCHSQMIEVEVVDYNAVKSEFVRKLTTHDSRGIRLKDGQPTWKPRPGKKGGWYLFDKNHRKVYLSQISKKQLAELLATFPEAEPEVNKVIQELHSKEQKSSSPVPPPSSNSDSSSYSNSSLYSNSRLKREATIDDLVNSFISLALSANQSNGWNYNTGYSYGYSGYSPFSPSPYQQYIYPRYTYPQYTSRPYSSTTSVPSFTPSSNVSYTPQGGTRASSTWDMFRSDHKGMGLSRSEMSSKYQDFKKGV
eukprot:TRINITY_DN16025_c0_g1_i1.p1 TRINITY_DN16025_c0_g1~~TRINITY_DN16025_c0_g1_i1.p1  ORF type:complete len:329 (-),score=21.28 TRINITY_DN16025_c0_g1_i1:52-912(-)